ncbi:MAG TPA: UDP-N-acetylmuramoyl-L-alanine--D-glutamate ligase [Polyangiaceae bacterium]|nr:UDP-N-acetylmuramoyl-L-alanine--D-glutamate ligase [Polyangiaceae bacterium]
MELSNRKVVVVGLGKSGVAAAKLCLANGARVIGTDSAPLASLSPEARGLGIELCAGGHEAAELDRADVIVLSPGVADFPALSRAARAGAEVIGELELASRFVHAPVLAVGGTNGKSTATSVLAALLQAAGLRVFAGANLGRPAAEAAEDAYDVIVWEVSSFQMERVPTFRPKVSVLLNISEDHLDRYSGFSAYATAKGNAFVNQGEGDVAIVPAGDAACLQQARRGHGRIVTFGTDADYATQADAIYERATGASFSLADAQLHGRHNHDNAAAAVAAARAFGVDADAVGRGLAAFRPLPHRMARAGTVRGVTFYDDSKATNVGAAVTALLGLAEARAVLIAGGRDKHGSYAPLVQALEQKARAVVLVGEAADRIAAAVAGRVPVLRAASMTHAVRAAFGAASPGDAVLLSPACSSFDMFSSYAARGDAFVSAVQELGADCSEVTA